ncbi:hypothetical protein [Streptomyces sp. NBC_00996]|uniref:hypothetical protein n=1 Tax=Streptomyces sp. NBC_00996 TaxID=2903710 RepID=UPI00386759C3|nr:hypothetical protein OG390_02805 [Streptomyces sp. NBC_00996]
MSPYRAADGALTAGGLPKPLDLGNGLVAASFGADGSWLSIGAPHPLHGFVEMSGAPPFEEPWRGDPAAVRRYRGWLTEDRYAFLRLDLPDEEVSGRRVGVDEEGRPVWRRTGQGWSCSATAWALPNRQVLVQRYVIEAVPGVRAVLRFSGRLDRCALAEITEVNPPTSLEVHSEVNVRGVDVAVSAAELATSALVTVDAPAGSPSATPRNSPSRKPSAARPAQRPCWTGSTGWQAWTACCRRPVTRTPETGSPVTGSPGRPLCWGSCTLV